jgi:hypothetical protein
MARPIAYNASGPLSGSIRGGSVNYTIDGAGRDYTTFAGKKWVPSADGAAPIIFVTDSFTRGLTTAVNAYPLFFSCAGTGSAAILYTANRLPGSPGNFTDTGSAFYDLTFSYGYFILEGNDPFEGVDADSLALDLDASKISSYPQTLAKWFDISGNGIQGNLINGPAWNSNGWFQFDGVDDYVSAGNLGTIGNNQTIEVWFNSNSVTSYKNVLDMNYSTYNPNTGNVGPRLEQISGDGLIWIWSGDTVNNGINNVTSTYLISDNQWYHTIFTLESGNYNWYINGTLIDSGNSPKGYITTYGDVNLGRGFILDPSRYFSGLESSARIYKKTLSEAEVKQNYFGAPIVTDGLVFAVDANNIVSYPKSGTTWYGLTGSINGTLINGPIFNQENGGSIRFDGTDTYVTIPYNSALDIPTAITVEVWVKYASQGEIGGVGRTYSVISYKGYPWTWLLEDISGQFNFRISTTSDGDSRLDSNYYHGVERWDHVACTYNGTTQAIYVNGILQNSKSLTGTIITSGTTIELGTYGSGDYSFNGWLANHRVYDRALTAAEIQQNYQAEQYRFEGPVGPVTNGLLLYWDAGNLDSYPGTGTIIYDLSGNGNNGTLYNGVGFNQTNGGVLIFDGVDDYVGTSSPSLPSTNNTVMGAARYSGGTRGRMINATSNNWLIGCWNNSTENYYAEGWVSPVQNGANDTNWRIVTALGDIGADSYASYTNNILTGGPNNGGSQGPAGITVGKIGYTNSEYSTGEFGFVLVYNRVLTTAEMTQNYNYFKGRFGL